MLWRKIREKEDWEFIMGSASISKMLSVKTSLRK